MYSSYNTTPPVHLIKNQIRKFSKRIAIVQSLFVGSLIAIVGILYSVKDDLIALFELPLDDIDLLQEALTDIVEANQAVFSIMSFLLIALLVAGVMYLIAFFRLSKSFRLLASIIPVVRQPALKVGNFLRYALMIQIASVFLGSMMGTTMSYVSQIITAIGFGLFIAAYYNLGLVFKALYNNNLYPKKESRLLLFSQIAPVAALIPLTFSIVQLSSGEDINLIPLIIGGVIILLGYIGLAIGFFNLSKDIMLVEGPQIVDHGYETSTVYVQPPQYSSEPRIIHEVQPEKIPQKTIHQPAVSIDDQTAIYCSNCGRKLKEGKAFCHHCGMKVEDL